MHFDSIILLTFFGVKGIYFLKGYMLQWLKRGKYEEKTDYLSHCIKRYFYQ